MSVYTHEQLVTAGRHWLSSRSPVVLTELKSSAQECPDVWGVLRGKSTVLIECKASRADFLADAQKLFRQYPETGAGNFRYFLAPVGMLSVQELPDKWGLLEIRDTGRVRRVHPAVYQECNREAELQMLTSVLRRLSPAPGNHMSIRVYEIQTQCTAGLTLWDAEEDE